MIHACQVLNYAEEIFRENGKNSGVELNAMNSAAEEIQNATCTLVCIVLVDVLLFAHLHAVIRSVYLLIQYAHLYS